MVDMLLQHLGPVANSVPLLNGTNCARCGRTDAEVYETTGRRLQLCHSYTAASTPTTAVTVSDGVTAGMTTQPTAFCMDCHTAVHSDAELQQARFQETLRACEQLLTALGVDWQNDSNFHETPRRAALHFLSHFLMPGQVELALEEMKMAVFPGEYRGIVAVKPIRASGMCPHHLITVRYAIRIAYIPQEHEIGISKIPRAAITCAALPMLQEDLTTFLAQTISDVTQSPDVAVVITGDHQCMSTRGVEQSEATTTTAVLLGVFLSDGSARTELLELIKL